MTSDTAQHPHSAILTPGGIPREFLSGGGEMGTLIRAKNWADTPLGASESWPQSLKTVVRILASSRYQMWVGWGEDLSFFYNDAYKPTLGIKHGWALGSPAKEVWKEIWPDIGPRIDHVIRTGEATWDEGLLLVLERSGYAEETYHTFSYSPLSDDAGDIVGLLCVVMEETERVIGERRLSTLGTLSSGIAAGNTRADILTATQRALETNNRDLPFTLVYLFDQAGHAVLACAVGVQPGESIAPMVINQADAQAVWPLYAIEDTGKFTILADLDQRFERLPKGAWDKPPSQAVILPIARQGQDIPAGFLIAGINPYRRPDDAYLGFIELIAGQVASGLANADAYEEERRRAAALAEIDRAKTTFFSNVSHEFRTPLTLMLGPLEEVLVSPEGGLGLDQRKLVQVAHRNGIRLLKLVNTLLDFSRIEAGRAQPNFEPVDFATLTTDLASNFRSAIERAGLKLGVTCAALPDLVYVDRDMWEKIVLNLLSNAFKFTFEGEISVEIRASDDGHNAEVTIRDSGTGISAEDLPHLFERFRRVENARGRSIEGSGIGLALVRELVKLHGGDIRVVSQLGKGSAFTVAIPFGTAHLLPDWFRQNHVSSALSLPRISVRARAYVDEAAGWLSPTDAESAELPPSSTAEDLGDLVSTINSGGQLVLLADDNVDMRNYLTTLLQTAGYRVEAVADGTQALAAAHRLRPDLILSDVMMPNLDGFGLLSALRADNALHDIPILLLSARAGEEAKVEGLSAGADDYLTKPFSARELMARVRVNLEIAASRREAVAVEKTLRQQAQLAQERSEAILASISDGFLALDQDWRFSFVNAAAERIMQRRGGSLIGQNCWEVLPDALSDTLDSGLRHAMLERENIAFEDFSMPLGKWLDVRAYPARDGGLSVYFRDITTRKNIEETLRRLNETLETQVTERTAELRTKEARLRTIFETSFSYQALLALDGTLLDANATSLAGIGATLDDVIGKPFADLAWFSGTPGMSDKIREAIPTVAGGGITRFEISINLPVGGMRIFEFMMRPIRDESGTVVSIVLEAMEVTAQRQAEQTARQAQKMEGIGQLTGGVAHDFNNLLTIIVGNLETVQRQLRTHTADLGKVERSVENAMRGAHRAMSLTQHLLAFARQQPLDPKPVDVSRLVSGMSDLLRRTLGEQIAVETVLSGGLWRTNIDANQLEIAILNLAINARDAMPNGGRLTIETANTALDDNYAAGQSEVVPGQYVMLALTDNGLGMTEQTRAKAFEPFFTTKDVGHGTGLGLSQVYGFVKQSGGHVKIYSELGEGTTVKLYLPRLHSNSEIASDEPALKVARGRTEETILVVEDDDDVRAYTGSVLRELGYSVIEAANGKAALEIIDSGEDVQLLFTDVGLPGGMNGRRLAEAAQQRRPRLKVLFTTGYARNAIVHDGRLDPGVHLITKPFTYASLAEKVSSLINSVSASTRILIVEDEVLIQMLLSTYLEELGFDVEIAGTAAEAKSKLGLLQGEVAAAIIDIGLPDSKGDDLLRELRTIYPTLPILVSSGYGQSGIATGLANQTSIGLLNKPYTIDQLRQALAAIGVVK